jgi:hypothetical protein
MKKQCLYNVFCNFSELIFWITSIVGCWGIPIIQQLLLELCEPQNHHKRLPLCSPSANQDCWKLKPEARTWCAEASSVLALQQSTPSCKSQHTATIYSFVQVAGIVNDHISFCFGFQVCSNVKNVGARVSIVWKNVEFTIFRGFRYQVDVVNNWS